MKYLVKTVDLEYINDVEEISVREFDTLEDAKEYIKERMDISEVSEELNVWHKVEYPYEDFYGTVGVEVDCYMIDNN